MMKISVLSGATIVFCLAGAILGGAEDPLGALATGTGLGTWLSAWLLLVTE